MSILTVTGQLEPVKPLGARSWFMRQGEGDLAALKAISDAWAVPAWVLAGGGTIGSRRALLSDDMIEQACRDWIWRNINYTGTAAGGTVPTTGRALDIYNWLVTNAALNGGLGPTIDCGNTMNLYVGFLAAYGIPARVVWMHKGSTGSVDMSAEYWSPGANGWVHTSPHINARDQWTVSGVGASMLDAVTVARQLGSRVGVVDQVNQGGSTGVGFKSGVGQDLTLYNDWCRWGRGNRVQFATGAPGDPAYTETGGNRFSMLSLLDPTAGANAGQVSAQDGSTTKARDLTDITFTPSALIARSRVTAQGLVEVALEATMLDTGITYQVKAPAGSWLSLPNPAHTFYPVLGDAWQYRAVGPLGNTTNTVTVTVVA
jgi:hypothetical protein